MTAIQAFMRQILDYAGLFPPANLDLRAALGNYHSYQLHKDSDYLGRFIMPLWRLNEATRVYGDVMSSPEREWQFSGLLRCGSFGIAQACQRIDDAATGIATFNRDWGRVQIDSVEVDLPTEAWSSAENFAALRRFLQTLENSFSTGDGRVTRIFIELDWRKEFEPVMALVGQEGPHFAVKLRTGGLTPDTIPPAGKVVEFLEAASKHRLAFKSTAGLHVPVPHHDAGVRARMHGFLNVFAAGFLVFSGQGNQALAANILENFSYEHLGFTETSFKCGESEFSVQEIRELRSRWMLSFGSCSFLEPLEQLQKHGLV